jgi:hypothetical protein
MRLAHIGLVLVLAGCAEQPSQSGSDLRTASIASSSPASAVPSSSSSSSAQACTETVTLELLVAVEPARRLECFGDTEITFKGFRTEVFGAGGCPGDQIAGEDWLRPCVEEGILIAPALGRADGLLVHLHPGSGLAIDTVPVGVQLTVTGHFDDPAAHDCRLLVNGAEVIDAAFVEACRIEFVATKIDAP